MNLFFDTNALVKLYHVEQGSVSLDNFLTTSENINIQISDLTIVEFHSAFMRKLRLKEIHESKIKLLFDIFENDIKLYNVIKINSTVLDLSVQLIDKYSKIKSLNTLDSIQLSSAIISNQINPISHFVSSDLKLIEVAIDYFEIFNPEF